jgi:phage-related protein
MDIIIFDDKTKHFLLNLNIDDQLKVTRLRDLLKEFGHQLRMPYSKKISNNLFELRSNGNIKVRILYTFKFHSAIILHAFIKKSQKIPKQEVEIALHKLRTLDNI